MSKKKQAKERGHRSTLNTAIAGRNRRFADSRDKRGKQRSRRDIERQSGDETRREDREWQWEDAVHPPQWKGVLPAQITANSTTHQQR